MKKEIKSLILFKNAIIYLVIIAIMFSIFIYSHFFNNIEGHRGGNINTIHVNEGPYRIGSDSRFTHKGVEISTNVYDQNSYCINNPQSTPCKAK